MYRTPAVSIDRAAGSARGTDREDLALRFATIRVNQLRGCPRRKPNLRPILCRVTRLDRRSNHTGRNELVKAARATALRLRARRNEFSHHSAMRGNRNTLSRLNPPYEATQVVFEFANACGRHAHNYSYMWPHLTTGAVEWNSVASASSARDVLDTANVYSIAFPSRCAG
jgi:hypothetical protein